MIVDALLGEADGGGGRATAARPLTKAGCHVAFHELPYPSAIRSRCNLP